MFPITQPTLFHATPPPPPTVISLLKKSSRTDIPNLFIISVYFCVNNNFGEIWQFRYQLQSHRRTCIIAHMLEATDPGDRSNPLIILIHGDFIMCEFKK